MAVRILVRLIVIIIALLATIALIYGLSEIIWPADSIGAIRLKLAMYSVIQSANAWAVLAVIVACLQGALLGTAIELIRRGKQVVGRVLLAVGIVFLVAPFFFLQPFVFIIPQMMIIGIIVVMSVVVPHGKVTARHFEYNVVLFLFLAGVLIIALDQSAEFIQSAQPDFENSNVAGLGGSPALSEELIFSFYFGSPAVLRSIGFRQPPAISLARIGDTWQGKITVRAYVHYGKPRPREPLGFEVVMPRNSYIDLTNRASSTNGTKCSKLASVDLEIVSCSMSLRNGENTIILESDWTPDWEYVRLGEERTTFLLEGGSFGDYSVTADRPAPVLTLQVDPVVNEISDAQPLPAYQLPRLVSWSLFQEGRTITEITLIDRRLRFLADQGIEIILLALGLLLVLVVESRVAESVEDTAAPSEQYNGQKRNVERSRRSNWSVLNVAYTLVGISVLIRRLGKKWKVSKKRTSPPR